MFAFLGAVEDEFEEWFVMCEDHFRGFGSGDYGGPSAGRAVETFVSEYFQSAVGTPDVFVSPSDEHGLPDPEMFLGAAVPPFRYC